LACSLLHSGFRLGVVQRSALQAFPNPIHLRFFGDLHRFVYKATQWVGARDRPTSALQGMRRGFLAPRDVEIAERVHPKTLAVNPGGLGCRPEDVLL
jgi:hypothetical protein